MEEWQDTGIVLTARMHGENGAIISVLTQNNGKHCGYLNGARSRKNRALIEPATIVSCHWKARTSENLGGWKLEEKSPTAIYYIDEPLKLAAIQSICHLYDEAIPDREGHIGLFEDMSTFLEMLDNDLWLVSYIYWELAFLKEMGFGLDLTRCAAGGNNDDLIYVSPKSAIAVSREKGEPYKDKLLKLPPFLSTNKSKPNDTELLQALKLNSFFLENKAFAQHSHGIPQARLIFQQRFANYISNN